MGRKATVINLDALQFAAMLGDKHIVDLKKMKYKYLDCFDSFLETLAAGYYKQLPLRDFSGKPIVYLPSCTGVNLEAVKLLCANRGGKFGVSCLEDEIISTSSIESIDFSRDSVRSIMKGFAPKDEAENRIFGLKQGFEFISNKENRISEANIFKLYEMSVGNYLDDSDKLPEGSFYRNDAVYVVGSAIEHTGIGHEKLPKRMAELVKFANHKDGINDLLKAAMLHFYIAFLHPYFDGNGRMARLLHMWYLIRQGYESTLFVPLSSYIERSRKKYYDSFTLIEENCKLSGVIDITPFLKYYSENVYDKISKEEVKPDTLAKYSELLQSGEITAKEAELWQFVLSAYASKPFTTKQLEKDFGNAAFATVRKFVMKFTEMGLFTATKLSNKVLYAVKL